MSRAFRSRRRLTGGARATFKSTAMRVASRLSARKKRRSFRPGFDRTSGAFTNNIRLELKFKDTSISDPVVAATGFISTNLLLIPQGTSDNTRIGRLITLRSIGFKFQWKLPSKTVVTDMTDTVRVMVIQDKQANGTLPAVGDILKQTELVSFNELNNKRRFRTLMDRVYDMNSSGMAGNGTTQDSMEVVRYDSWFKKLNMPIDYSSSVGSITELKSNNIFVLLISTDGNCSFDGNVRMRFSDM